MNYEKVVKEQESLREWWQADNERIKNERIAFWGNVAMVAKVVEIVTGFALAILGGIVILAIALCTGQSSRSGKK
jgi:hypothetical protein